MNPSAVLFAICCLASARARPSISQGTTLKLEGVPNESHYGKLTYPKYDLIELGSSVKGSLPPSVVEITKKIIITQPKPYPVKVPVPVPHPVEVAKPYPVIETKIVKIPHPVPVEVIKQIPVPIEVPKPYPVPSHEVRAPSHDAPVSTYGGSFGGHEGLGFGHQQLNDIQEASQQQGFGGGHGGGLGSYESSGSENSWGASLAPQEQGGWGAPLGGSDQGDSHEGSDQSAGYESGYEGSNGDYAQADSSQVYTAQAEPEVEYHPTGWIPIPSSRALGYHAGQRQY